MQPMRHYTLYIPSVGDMGSIVLQQLATDLFDSIQSPSKLWLLTWLRSWLTLQLYLHTAESATQAVVLQMWILDTLRRHRFLGKKN